MKMKLTPPKPITWWAALILGVLALLGYFKTITFLTPYAFWLAMVGLVLMLVAAQVKEL